MSTATVGALNIELLMKLDTLQTQFDQFSKTAKTHTDKVGGYFKDLKKSVEEFATAFVSVETIKGLVEFGKSVVETGAEIQHSADATRISAESFQVLGNLAKQSGLDISLLTRGLDAMEKKIADAAGGVKSAQQPFERLGIEISKIKDLSPDQQFELLAKSVLESKDQTEAFRDVVDILGARSAPKLLEAIKQLGEQGFDNLKVKMQQSGLIMSDAVVQKLDDIEKSLGISATKIKTWAGTFIAETFATSNSTNDLKVKISSLTTELDKVTNHPNLFDTSQFRSAKEEINYLNGAIVDVNKNLADNAAEDAKANQKRLDNIEKVKTAQYEEFLISNKLFNEKIALNQRVDLSFKLSAETAKASSFDYNDFANTTFHNSLSLITRDLDAQQTSAKKLNYELKALIIKDFNSTNDTNDLTKKDISEIQSLYEKTQTSLEKYNITMAKLHDLEVQQHSTQTQAIIDKARIAAVDELNADNLTKSAAIYDATRTPLEKYNEKIKEYKELSSNIDINTGKAFMSDETAARAAKQALEVYNAELEKNDLFNKRLIKASDQLAKSLSSTFVDGIMNGKKFGVIMGDLGKEIEKVVLQLLIMAPLESALKSMLGGFTGGITSLFGGSTIPAIPGHAAGGYAPAGQLSMVGEQGPELFIPETSGTIISNSQLKQGGSNSGTYHFNYSFGSGVTKAELMPYLAMVQQNTLAKIADVRRRGGGLSAAYG